MIIIIRGQAGCGVRRWTMRLRQKLLPWRPALVFTGRSYYTVESASGRLSTQTDVWDAIKDNSYLSARPRARRSATGRLSLRARACLRGSSFRPASPPDAGHLQPC